MRISDWSSDVCSSDLLVEPYWLQCNRTARPGESDMDRPDYLAAGEPARLIPVTADGNKELRAASILLATLSSVRPFAQELLGSLGQRIGKRARLECYTERSEEHTSELQSLMRIPYA